MSHAPESVTTIPFGLSMSATLFQKAEPWGIHTQVHGAIHSSFAPLRNRFVSAHARSAGLSQAVVILLAGVCLWEWIGCPGGNRGSRFPQIRYQSAFRTSNGRRGLAIHLYGL